VSAPATEIAAAIGGSASVSLNRETNPIASVTAYDFLQAVRGEPS
jgi:hypothetical protein